jgi:uncharacterized protein YcgI (DUF1989 family)
MVILKSQVVPRNSGAAFELRKGQRLRIAGKSIVDFVASNPESSAFLTIGVRT